MPSNMSCCRLDGRGYTVSNLPPSDDSLSVMGSRLAIADGGDNRASELAAADSSKRGASSTDDIEHLRAKAASAQLQKKSTDLLLLSEQQRTKRLNAALDELQKRHNDIHATLCSERDTSRQGQMELDQLKKEHEQLKKELSYKNNQLVQKALQLDQQRKAFDEHKEENATLALENEKMTTEMNHARRTLHKQSEKNEALSSIGEDLSINFAQHNIKYSALEKEYNIAEARAKDLSVINTDLQNSTNTLQSAFEDNLQALDTLRKENETLKCKLQSMTGNYDCKDRKEHIMAKLHQRRKLLALVKEARAAAEKKANNIADEGPTGFDTAAKIQAGWDSFVQNNDSIVTVLRGCEWVEAIDLKKKDTSLPWVEYLSDGITQAVSEDKIRRKRKQPTYYESPPTPAPKAKKKHRSFYIGVA